MDESARHTFLRRFDATVAQQMADDKSLNDILQSCSQSIVDDLKIAFVRIWTTNSAFKTLELRAGAGESINRDQSSIRSPSDAVAMQQIASDRKPFHSNDLTTNPGLTDRSWARQEGVVAFAGFPLLAEQDVSGVLAIYCRREVDNHILSTAADAAQRIGLLVRNGRETQPKISATGRLKSILDAATHVSIISTDTSGIIQDFNSGAERMLGYLADEMVEQQRLTAIHAPAEITAASQKWSNETGRQISGFDVLVMNARQGGVDDCEWTYVRKDGTGLTVNLVMTAVKDPTGEIVGFLAVATDISERKKTMDALRESEERFRELAETVHEVFWLIDAVSNRMLYVSPAYDSIWGESRELLYSNPLEWTKAIHPDERTRVENLYVESLRTGEFDTDYCLVRPDGSNRWIHARGFPVRDATGSVVRIVGVSEDITLRKKMEQALRSSNEELEAFCYSVSHDLRAPLRHVAGFSQAIMEDYADKLDDDGKDMLGMIREATQKMGALIDDLLALSRVSRREMQIEEIELSEMFDDLAEEMKNDYPRRNLQFIVSGKGLVPGDRRMLRLALFNLVDNAVKYSALKDPAIIEFGCARSATGPVFFVRDNGTGFDEKYYNKLFVPFQRLHRDEEFTGTGIGLAIVKRVINRHGGRVWAEAVQGQGAIFSFTIGRELRLNAADST